MGDPGSLISSWLTPSSLFIVVNLVIGTIAITSRFGSTPKDQPQQLLRSPSLLQRVRSFNFARYEPDTAHPQPLPTCTPSLSDHRHEEEETQRPEPEKPELARSPSLLQRIQSMNLSRFYRSESMHQVETRKSAAEWEEEEAAEEVERRRPATATATATATCREDEEVDAKADDFINSFKKQLRLQRIESLLRYRGAS